MELTGEKFTPEVLQHARKREQYFDPQGRPFQQRYPSLQTNPFMPGNLLRIDEIFSGSVAVALKNYATLKPEDIQPAADFITSCLRLDPLKRPSARELQLAPWLKSAFTC